MPTVTQHCTRRRRNKLAALQKQLVSNPPELMADTDDEVEFFEIEIERPEEEAEIFTPSDLLSQLRTEQCNKLSGKRKQGENKVFPNPQLALHGKDDKSDLESTFVAKLESNKTKVNNGVLVQENSNLDDAGSCPPNQVCQAQPCTWLAIQVSSLEYNMIHVCC
jgi:hypothetical protein